MPPLARRLLFTVASLFLVAGVAAVCRIAGAFPTAHAQDGHVAAQAAGTYSSEWGAVTLVQDGASIGGHWVLEGGQRGEIVSGTLQGDQLTLQYRWGSDTGTAVFTYAPGPPARWEGNFRHTSGLMGAWNLRLQQPGFADPRPSGAAITRAAGSSPAPRQAAVPAGASSPGSQPPAGKAAPVGAAGAPAPPAPSPPPSEALANLLGGSSASSSNSPASQTSARESGQTATRERSATGQKPATAGAGSSTSAGSSAPRPPSDGLATLLGGSSSAPGTAPTVSPPAARPPGQAGTKTPDSAAQKPLAEASGGSASQGSSASRPPSDALADLLGTPRAGDAPPRASAAEGSASAAAASAAGAVPTGASQSAASGKSEAVAGRSAGAPKPGTAPARDAMRDSGSIPSRGKPSSATGAAIADPAVTQALRAISESGERFLRSKDKREESLVRSSLSGIHDKLKVTLKRTPGCEDCREQLAWTLYYRARYGIDDSYTGLLQQLQQDVKQFPDNSTFLYLLGNGAVLERESGLAVYAFRRFLALKDTKPEWQTQARAALESAQRDFQMNWYRQASFYSEPRQSKVLRIFDSGKKVQQAQQTLASTKGAADVAKKGLEQVGSKTGLTLPPGTQPASGGQAPAAADPAFWSAEKEMQLGTQALQGLGSQRKDLPDPEIQSYVHKIVMKLVDRTPGPPYQYTVTVLDSDEMNAFAVPGAVLVNRGLLRFAENEAELACVLAHELGHNYGHHMARMAMHQEAAQQGIGMAGKLLAGQSPAARLAANLTANVAANLLLTAYNRSEEREADIYATHIAYNAGYNPTFLTSVFLRMYKANPKERAKFLSKHPPVPDRIDYVTMYIDAFPLGKEMKLDSAEFQAIKKKVGAAATAGKGKTAPAAPVLNP